MRTMEEPTIAFLIEQDQNQEKIRGRGTVYVARARQSCSLSEDISERDNSAM